MTPRLRFIAFVLLALTLTGTAVASLTVVPRGSKDNTNFPGRDIRSFRSDGAMNCSEVCDRTRGCMAWTWVRPGLQGPKGVCWLKDGAPTVVRDTCCMSGLKDTEGKREPQVNRPGMDYRNFELARPAPALCEEACAKERRCRAWTYVEPGVQGNVPRCWLKSGVPNPVADRCCTSGVHEAR